MKAVWQIGIDRVVLTGIAGRAPDAAALAPAIERAVAATLADAPLPAGPRAAASVHVRAGTLDGAAAIATAVAGAVVQALRGRGAHG
jgi:hypothetical protein